MLNKIVKIIAILLISILFLNMSANTIFAAIEVNLNKAYIEKIGKADYHLKYYKEDKDKYTYVICSIVGYYDENDNFNPTYCMNKNLVGAEEESYYVKVNNLLKNDKVWRVIKNGYPFKSAEELGLSDEYDAFAVTKFAVYCILGQSKLEYFKAEEDDDEAVAMLEALKNLVKIGENGTEKQNENPIKLQKVGELKEEEKYYSQEYKLASTSDFSNYEISRVTGLPSGGFVSDINGNKSNRFKKGNNFKVMIPKEKMTEDYEVKLTAKAECKSYVVLEGKTTVSNTQNYVVTAGEFATATTEETLNIKVNKASIVLNKVQEDTDIPVPDVKFGLYKDKKLVQEKTTDKNGKIKFENLYPGKYILKEIEANEDYILDTTEHELELKYKEEKEITVSNKLKPGQVKVIKVDSENNEIKIEGVKFQVLDKDGKVLEEITTDEKGEAITQKYSLKQYEEIYLKEIETDSNYVLNDEITEVKLEANRVKNIQIENEKIKGKIKIIKTSKDDNIITGQKAGSLLEGVKFEIYNSKNKLVEKLTTDKNGVAISKDLEKGDYKIKEIETNKYYYLNEKNINVTIEKDKEVVSVSITNESQNPNIDIEKSGTEKAEIGGKIEYDISVRNTGNTKLDNFIMQDIFPSNSIKVTSIKTGTYNQDIKYNIYYKTNMSTDYVLLMEDLNSKENYEINFEKELAENEFLTEIKFDFGTVEKGFNSNENPHVTGKVKENVKSEEIITNTANVFGEFEGYKVTDTSKWKTFCFKLLPKTGF